MPRRNANAGRAGCAICAHHPSMWRAWEPSVECLRHGPSTAKAGGRITLNEERPRLATEVVLSHSEVSANGARRGPDRTL